MESILQQNSLIGFYQRGRKITKDPQVESRVLLVTWKNIFVDFLYVLSNNSENPIISFKPNFLKAGTRQLSPQILAFALVETCD